MGLFGRVVLIVGVLVATVTVGALAATGRTTACPTLSQARALPVWQKGGVAFGDVEGSGYRGRASVRYARDASSTCGFILVVKTRKGALAARVPERDYAKGGSWPIQRWPYSEPYVGTVVRLGGARNQFVVARWHGRSTSFLSLYGVIDGRLALLPFHGGAAALTSRTELALGGTFYGSTTVRCVRGGPLTLLRLWVTFAKGKPSGMAFTRSTYHLGRKGFSLTRTDTTRGSDATISALAERAGFNHGGFTGCTVA